MVEKSLMKKNSVRHGSNDANAHAAIKFLRKEEEKKAEQKRAFTLVELLVTIGVIGILASMTLPALDKAKEHSKYTRCQMNQKHVLQSIQIELMNFSLDNNLSKLRYPVFDSNGTFQYMQDGPEMPEFWNSINLNYLIKGATPDPYLSGFWRPPLINCPAASTGKTASYFMMDYLDTSNGKEYLSTTSWSVDAFDISFPMPAPYIIPAVQDLPIYDPTQDTLNNWFPQPIVFKKGYLHDRIKRTMGFSYTLVRGDQHWVEIGYGGSPTSYWYMTPR